jgi:site-specific DNA-methyltransferase (adenine-specific)
MFGDAAIDFVTRKQTDNEFGKDIESLPYRFTDPHGMDKKIDPGKLKFGSRINKGDDGKQFEVYSVKEVLSPELLRLSNGLTVRLIGISEIAAQREQAVEFLKSKTKGQKILLKFDEKKHDEHGNLLSYVYLKNKTFVNAHLIKSGLVSIDTRAEYKSRTRFQSLHDQAEKHAENPEAG